MNKSKNNIFFQKISMLIIFFLVIELVFFKFIPDIGTAFYQNNISTLVSFNAFREYFLTSESVMYPRFLGNIILYETANFISSHYHSTDIRLHPLRIAAGILTPIYFAIGIIPIFFDRKINWQKFSLFYFLMFISGLYVFYPYDAPSIGLISLSMYFVIKDKLFVAFFFFILTGFFRESSFHLVIIVLIWCFYIKSHSYYYRVSWPIIYLISFIVQYKFIRYYFPAPIIAGGDGFLSFLEIFFGSGLLSLTTIVTLALILMFPIYYFLEKGDWSLNLGINKPIHNFFAANCYLVPLWVIFYRAMNGNITEFRMLWPALIPCIYGISIITNINRPNFSGFIGPISSRNSDSCSNTPATL